MEINKIYNENCLITLNKMPSNYVDMVLTSPPYDNLRQYNGYEFDFEPIAKELYRVLKENGIIVWIVGDATIKGSETGTSFKQALYFKKIGLKLHDTMIYEKNGSTYPARANSNRYTQKFEYMFVLAKGKVANQLIIDKKNKWGGHSNFGKDFIVPELSPRDNIWRYVTSFNEVKHPAPFPEELANDHIISWSKFNDLIYDPFMGSGTTAKMALLNNRNFIGSEISAEYVKLAENRLGLLTHMI